MNIYLILAKEAVRPNESNIKKLEAVGNVKVMIHKGKLGELQELKDDPGDKIIGIDPDMDDWNLDIEAFDTIKNVKGIFTNSTSFDWLKPKELRERGITACNCPGFSADSVAEYAICLAMEGARCLPLHLRNDWKPNFAAKGMLLKGKTLGVFGLGRIGTRIAEIGQGIGMNVIYWARTKRDKRFGFVEIEDLFKNSDVLIPALVESEKTHKLFTNELVTKMKKNALLVGLNRIKALIDEDFVMKRVEEGKLGGYIFEGDNAKPFDNYKGNVWGVPSIAWYTPDSLINLENIWVENMNAFVEGKPQNLVN